VVTSGHVTKMVVTPFHLPHGRKTHATSKPHGSVLQNRSYGHSKFYTVVIGIFDLFPPVTLTLTRQPSYTNLTCVPWRYIRYANMNFLRQGFWKQSSDRQTWPKLYSMPLHRWSTIQHKFITHRIRNNAANMSI